MRYTIDGIGGACAPSPCGNGGAAPKQASGGSAGAANAAGPNPVARPMPGTGNSEGRQSSTWWSSMRKDRVTGLRVDIEILQRVML